MLASPGMGAIRSLAMAAVVRLGFWPPAAGGAGNYYSSVIALLARAARRQVPR